MKIKNMNQYFSLHILKRGYDYYHKGNIIDAKKIEEQGYQFIVEGTREYTVTIHFHNSDIEMNCNCPYARDGFYCKHMAAALYMLKNEDIESNPIKKVNKKVMTPLDMFREKVDQDYILANDEGFYDDEYGCFDEDFEEEHIKEVKNQLWQYREDIIHNYVYYHTVGIDCLFYLMKSVQYSCMYDYSVAHFFASMLSYMIVKDAKYVGKCLKEYYKVNRYFCIEILEELNTVIKEEDEAKGLVIIIDGLLEEHDVFYNNRLQRIKYVLLYNWINKESALEFAEYCYKHNDEILMMLVELYNSKGNMKESILLLEKALFVKKTQGRYEVIIDICKKLEDIEKYKKYLLDYFYYNPDFNTYVEIKKQFSKEEMITISKQIKVFLLKQGTSSMDKEVYTKVCEAEKDIEGLMTYCYHNLSALNTYIGWFIGKCDQQVLDNCKESILVEARGACSRKEYHRIVEYMFILTRLHGGEEAMKDLANSLIQTYSNRAAMKDELAFFLASI